MNKAELVEEIADQPGLIRKTSTEAIGGVIPAVTDSLTREERISSVGFGASQVMERKAKKRKGSSTGTDYPRTGKEIPQA